MNILSLFTVPVVETKLDKEISISNFELVNINSNTLQSKNRRVLEKFPHVREGILEEFQKVVDKWLFYSNKFMISTSWFAVLNKGDSSALHNHKHSHWSGIYYFGDYKDGESSPILFVNPLGDISDFCLDPEKCNPYNGGHFIIKPEKGKLIFFPSYLKHQILSHQSDTPRESLAFNIVPVGEYGFVDSTYNTEWF
jgi:uncharacterized protein (TIGR02466 family)